MEVQDVQKETDIWDDMYIYTHLNGVTYKTVLLSNAKKD